MLRTVILLDLLLCEVDEAGDPLGGTYDETRGYTVLDGQPLVAISAGREQTETKVDREPPDRELWAFTETQVAAESRDADNWSATVTITRISHEADDSDV
jgi:hypothetical protein